MHASLVICAVLLGLIGAGFLAAGASSVLFTGAERLWPLPVGSHMRHPEDDPRPKWQRWSVWAGVGVNIAMQHLQRIAPGLAAIMHWIAAVAAGAVLSYGLVKSWQSGWQIQRTDARGFLVVGSLLLLLTACLCWNLSH